MCPIGEMSTLFQCSDGTLETKCAARPVLVADKEEIHWPAATKRSSCAVAINHEPSLGHRPFVWKLWGVLNKIEGPQTRKNNTQTAAGPSWQESRKMPLPDVRCIFDFSSFLFPVLNLMDWRSIVPVSHFETKIPTPSVIFSTSKPWRKSPTKKKSSNNFRQISALAGAFRPQVYNLLLRPKVSHLLKYEQSAISCRSFR